MQIANRVFIIGLDGATWDVLDPWIRDGTLPHFAALRERSSWGPLRSSIPPITAAAWSTFMTGKRPGKHGVYHFIKLFDDNHAAASEAELVSARSIKSATLWDSMGHHHRNVTLINIPLTYPPRPVKGVMITGLLTPSSAPVFTYPPELSAKITNYKIDLDRFIDKTPYVDTFDTELTAPTLSLVKEFQEMEERRAEVTFSLMDSEPWDFFMVVFTSTDRLGHYFWPYHRVARAADPPAVQQLCQAVRAFYIRLDEIVGELIERVGQDTIVMMMSDHGMGPTYTKRLHCNNWLHQHGWLTVKSNGTPLANPDGWLKRLGLPRDKVGRLIRRIPGLAGSQVVRKATNSRAGAVDLERSKAYCVPIFHNIMGIRVQLDGEAKAALCRDIMQGLQAIVDPETGQPIVQQVHQAADYYSGPYTGNIPDIIASIDPDYGCSYYVSHYSSIVTKREDTGGPAKHRMEGIFMAHGPGVAAQVAPLPNLRIEDIAPTVLHVMGLPVPADMDGRVLTEILDPAVLEANPVRHEAPPGFWPKEDEALFSDAVMSAEDEEVIRGRLRSLGYFE
jgi:predicted AlkP superfamily phosphohydrolase/phosphomutase